MFNEFQVAGKQLLRAVLVILETHANCKEMQREARLRGILPVLQNTGHKLAGTAASCINLNSKANWASRRGEVGEWHLLQASRLTRNTPYQ
eukprot:954040-Pleurochrysis_carterae.AAC.1